jgi:hypothetical protein
VPEQQVDCLAGGRERVGDAREVEQRAERIGGAQGGGAGERNGHIARLVMAGAPPSAASAAEAPGGGRERPRPPRWWSRPDADAAPRVRTP